MSQNRKTIGATASIRAAAPKRRMTIGDFDRRDLDQRSPWTMRTSRSDGAPFAPCHRWAVCIGEGGCRRSELVHPDRNFGSTGLQCRLGGDAGGHLASSNHDVDLHPRLVISTVRPVKAAASRTSVVLIERA